MRRGPGYWRSTWHADRLWDRRRPYAAAAPATSPDRGALGSGFRLELTVADQASDGPLGDELIGETVQLRATQQKLNIYHNDRLIASYMLSENDERPDAIVGEEE